MHTDSTFLEDTDFGGQSSAHYDFDFASLDTIEDTIKETLKRGGSVKLLLSNAIEAECAERTNEAIAAVLCHIADAKRPKLAVDCLAYATGMCLAQGMSASALAAKHGIRKQAFSQAALRLIRSLGLQPTRAMRSMAARQRMSNAYKLRTQNSHANSGGKRPIARK